MAVVGWRSRSKESHFYADQAPCFAGASIPICHGMALRRSERASFIMVVVALAAVWGPISFILLRLMGLH